MTISMQILDNLGQSDSWFAKRAAYFKRIAFQGGARSRLYKAVKEGLIVPKDYCQLCGAHGLPSKEIIAHHADYSRPLDVIWLCKSCHQFHHKNNGNIK